MLQPMHCHEMHCHLFSLRLLRKILNFHSPLVTLVSQNITWTCESWIKQFRDTLQRVTFITPNLPISLTPLPGLLQELHTGPATNSRGNPVLFRAYLGQQGLANSTIRTYLSGVWQLQIVHGERIQVLTGFLAFSKSFKECRQNVERKESLLVLVYPLSQGS